MENLNSVAATNSLIKTRRSGKPPRTKYKAKKLHLTKRMKDGNGGERELEFYHNLKFDKSHDETTTLLKKIVPSFRGVSSVKTLGFDQIPIETKFLMLKDTARHFILPCIMKIRIEQQQESKNPRSSNRFLMNVNKLEYYKFDSKDSPVHVNVARSELLDISVHEAFGLFLNKDTNVEKPIAKKILKKLQPVKRFFEIQRKFKIISNSIIIAYDAHVLNNNLAGNVVAECIKTAWVRINVADFTETHPADLSDDTEFQTLHSNYNLAFDNILQILASFANE